MKAALAGLDRLLTQPTQLLIGGGAAMVLAYKIPLATADIDGLVVRSKISQAEMMPLVHRVADDLHLPKDWLNGYFNTFLFSLPSDYHDRLTPVFQGKRLRADALGREDLVILKCCAGREKDIPHARALMRQTIDRKLVGDHLQTLMEKGIAGAERAADFFDDLCDQVPE